MRAGDLDRRCSIEYPTIAQDEFGAPVKTWTRLAFAWAQVQDALPSRSEAVLQGLEIARNQTRVRMRYRSDVTSDMRIVVHGGTDTVYQIVGGPAMIGRKEFIEMVCEKFSS